jgi:hypothetical protein
MFLYIFVVAEYEDENRKDEDWRFEYCGFFPHVFVLAQLFMAVTRVPTTTFLSSRCPGHPLSPRGPNLERHSLQDPPGAAVPVSSPEGVGTETRAVAA